MFRMKSLGLVVSAVSLFASLSLFADERDPKWTSWDRWRTVYEHRSIELPPRDFDATVVMTNGHVVIRNNAGVRLRITNPRIPVIYQGIEYAVDNLKSGDRIRVSLDEKRSVRRIDVLERN